jgi:D-serine deaminase-like pyridoxal phosphate-dependent protein
MMARLHDDAASAGEAGRERQSRYLAAVETPALTVDLGAVERNIARMQSYCERHRLALRPHVKTHKSPRIAQMQLRAGACGVTCQKLGEAEVMAAAGVEDILVTFPLVGEGKLERAVMLARSVRLTLAGDSVVVAEGLSRAFEQAALEVEFLVECDTGLARTGVQSPAEAAALAGLVDSLPGLRFGGLMTYPTLPESGPWLRAARDQVEALGLRVDRVSGGGGLPTFLSAHTVEGIDEIRPGTYIYGDRSYLASGDMSLADCALRVQATVVSRPTNTRAIIDAGSKALSNDPVDADGIEGYGLIVEYPQARLHTLSEEHGHVDLEGCHEKPEIGEVVSILPNHACGAVNLHDRVLVHRDGELLGEWPVAARGRLS